MPSVRGCTTVQERLKHCCVHCVSPFTNNYDGSCVYSFDSDAYVEPVKYLFCSSLLDPLVASFLAVHKKESSLNATLMEGDTVEEILAELEAATVAMVKSTGVSMCSLDAEEAWELPQQFCRVHHLPLSKVYLRYCAEEGSWVSFLCHAQMHGFQHDEVGGWGIKLQQ